MEYFENSKRMRFHKEIAVIKLMSLILCMMSIFSSVDKDNIFTNPANRGFMYITIVCMILGTLFMYFMWRIFVVKIAEFKHSKYMAMLEVGIYLTVYTALMFFTGAFESNLKFLFLFIIITTTIQLGAKYGMFLAVTSSVIILTADLIMASNLKYNVYFEQDLILSAVFILSAWVLCNYVDMEAETMKQKNMELEKLDKTLNEHNKQREYMEQLLLKEDVCYNLLIENSTDAIVVHRDKTIIFCNESAARLVGLETSGELIGKRTIDFVPSAEINNALAYIDKIHCGEEACSTVEHEVIGGNKVCVRSTSTGFIYDGKATVLTILHDITPEKQVEKLEDDVQKNIDLLNESVEVNKLITEFFSNISHELKTPLNVIFSAIQLLNSTSVDSIDKYKEYNDKYMKIMKQNCYRLLRLINNLLDMTRLDSGFLTLNAKNYDIVNVVEEIVLSVVSFAETKGIEIIFDTDTEEKVIAIDPDKMERIVLNLLSNAIKFTPSGGQIFVDLEDLGGSVRVRFRDTGIGIPKEKAETIFERFVQVNKTLKRDHEGSGIGLAISKSFIEMHGGVISLNDTLQVGSEFIIELPVKECEQVYERDVDMYENNIERISIEFSDIYS